MMEKEYYSLDEASAQLGYPPSDLLYLGANESLPIYVLAADWLVDVHIREPDDDPNAGFSMSRFDWSGADVAFQDRLIGPVRLHPAALKKFEANPGATTRYFFM